MVTYTTQITQFYLLGIQIDIEGFVGKPIDISIPCPYSLIDNEYLMNINNAITNFFRISASANEIQENFRQKEIKSAVRDIYLKHGYYYKIVRIRNVTKADDI